MTYTNTPPHTPYTTPYSAPHTAPSTHLTAAYETCDQKDLRTHAQNQHATAHIRMKGGN